MDLFSKLLHMICVEKTTVFKEKRKWMTSFKYTILGMHWYTVTRRSTETEKRAARRAAK